MNWIKNNLGFVLIILGIIVFVFMNIFIPVSESITTELSQSNQQMTVEIKGQVNKPGIYDCEPDDRVIDIINIAGGLTIYADVDQINRSQKIEDEMVIEIPKLGNLPADEDDIVKYIQVEIKGEVQYPGVYKCPENYILNQLIDLAGGLTFDADMSDVNLAKKITANQLYDIPSLTSQNIHVEIKGEVLYPGIYEMKSSAMIYDLVEKAGGLLDSAYTQDLSMVEKLTDHALIIIPKRENYQLTMAVDIKGAVNQPGVYYFEEGDRLIDVIHQADGFASNADYQEINLSQKLNDEEVIIIPYVLEKQLIAIDVKGEVKFPGVYYLKEGSRVIDVIKLAGGFRPDANTEDINLSELLSDQDMVIIPTVTQDTNYIYVEIKGEVILPGVYAMKPGDRLIMLLNRAGGFTNSADEEHLNLTRLLIDEEIIKVPSIYEEKIFVSIFGEVYLPGNYEVSESMTFVELIYLAGGLTNQADIEDINFDQILSHGLVIIIPSISDEIPTLPDEIEGPININQATLEQLQTLTGIGIILAERIIEYRIEYGPFQSIEELKNVTGIGDAVYDKIKDDITVQ